jgi:hypothetical protein
LKKRPVNSTLLAVIIAVVLFLIANHFDDREPWQPGETPPASLNPQPASGLRGPLRATADTTSCDAAESAMLQAVEDAQHCRTDDDCTLFDYGYPIQCMTSVAKDDISKLRSEYRNYEASCRFRVYYDCPTDNTVRIAVCRANRCAVELESIDWLKEETLDHLGIGR